MPTDYLLLPCVRLVGQIESQQVRLYLQSWLDALARRLHAGELASSECIQAALAELALFGTWRTPWDQVADGLLTSNGAPIAYSAAYAKRLHQFDAQSVQVTINAIHSRWWIALSASADKVDHALYARLISTKLQPSGLYLDSDISPTELRHRMKLEIAQSAAQSAEILNAAGLLDPSSAEAMAQALVRPANFPVTNYLSAEALRCRALTSLDRLNLSVVSAATVLTVCAEGLAHGWCDFAMREKIDAYMGTAKRVGRDKPICSPLIACHAEYLAKFIKGDAQTLAFNSRLADYRTALSKGELSADAFRMRDLRFPFGPGMTPLEAISTSHQLEFVGNSDTHE
jgi:hypothetical protein